MDCVALTTNPLRPAPDGFLRGLVEVLEAGGVRVVADGDAARVLGRAEVGGLAEAAAGAGMVVVVGGDGSILRAVHSLLPLIRPVMGVNSGRLGFLSFSSATDPRETASAILNRAYVLSERDLLEAVVRRDGAERHRFMAVNEITVTRRKVARMIHVEAAVRGQLLNRYHADGLIVATPTGSTAYSMSAGGPVVAPEAPVLVLTPICPHALGNRSIVVSGEDPVVIRARPADDGDAVMISVDGETGCLLDPGDELCLKRAPVRLPLAMKARDGFFETLRAKLRWHGSNV